LLLADRRTDMTKLIVAFSNFANAPERTEVQKRRRGQTVDNKTKKHIHLTNAEYHGEGESDMN